MELQILISVRNSLSLLEKIAFNGVSDVLSETEVLTQEIRSAVSIMLLIRVDTGNVQSSYRKKKVYFGMAGLWFLAKNTPKYNIHSI